MKPLCCLVFTLAIPLTAAAAQEPPALTPGARVRVTAPDSRVVGTLESVDDRTIVVRRENGISVNVPLTGAYVDVSTGPGLCSSNRRGTCVLVGFLGGAALGLAAGKIAESQCAFCGGQVYPYTFAAGAAVGTILGMVIGGEHWEHVELPTRVSLTPQIFGASRSRGDVGVTVSLTF